MGIVVSFCGKAQEHSTSSSIRNIKKAFQKVYNHVLRLELNKE